VIIVTVAGSVLLTYKFGEFSLDVYQDGSINQLIIAMPVVAGLLALAQIASIIQHNDNLKLENKLSKTELKILDSKKPVIEKMDPTFKNEIFAILRNQISEIDAQNYDPNKV